MKAFWKKITALFSRIPKRVWLGAVALAVGAVLLVDLGHHVVKALSSDVETMPAKVSSLSQTFLSEAYLVFEETPLTVSGNKVVYLVDDGDKVAAGTPLAAVYPEEANDDYLRQLGSLYRAQRLLDEVSSWRVDKVSDTLCLKIAGVSLAIDEAMQAGDLRLASTYRAELEALSLCREKMLGTRSLTAIEEDLARDTARLESLVGEPLRLVTADGVGWFSSHSDAYAGETAIEGLLQTGYDDLLALLNADTRQSRASIGRLLTDYRFYAVATATPEQARALSQGKRYTVTLGGRDMTLTLEKTLLRGAEETVVLLFSGTTLGDALSLDRISSLSIETERYEGFKIPTAAVVYHEGVEGVWIQRGFVVDFREIAVLYRDENMLIAASDPENSSGLFRVLGENDNVIVKGENLYVGKIIG